MYGRVDFFTILKLFFKLLAVSMVLLVVGLLGWRFWVARVPAELKVLSPNDALVEAYEAHGSDLKLVIQEQGTTTNSESSYGYFTCCDAVFIPEARQLQLLVRYNDSTLRATEKDYELEEDSLDSDSDWYDISLVMMIDKTPEDSSDNLLKDLGEHRDSIGLERIYPTEVTQTKHTKLHNYRRLVFDNVDFEDTTLAVFVDFFFKNDIWYEKEEFDVYVDKSYATLCIYAYTEESAERELSKDDIKAIEDYISGQ